MAGSIITFFLYIPVSSSSSSSSSSNSQWLGVNTVSDWREKTERDQAGQQQQQSV